MGTQNRIATRLSGSQAHLASHSNILNNLSVASGDEPAEQVAVIWGTNFDIKEVEGKIRNFIKKYNPQSSMMEEGQH